MTTCKNKCWVPNCDGQPSEQFQETLGKTIKHQFHTFPREEERRKEWFWRIGLNTANNSTKVKHPRICSNHFGESAWTLKARLGFQNKNSLLETAIPTLLLPQQECPFPLEIQEHLQDINSIGYMTIRQKRKIGTILNLYRSQVVDLKRKLDKAQKEILEKEKCLEKAKEFHENKIRLAVTLASEGTFKKFGFNKDQQEAFTKSKSVHWTPETMRQATNLRDVAGSSAYNILRNDFRYPLPCLSTLRRSNSRKPEKKEEMEDPLGAIKSEASLKDPLEE